MISLQRFFLVFTIVLVSCQESKKKKMVEETLPILPPRFTESTRNLPFDDLYAIIKYNSKEYSGIFKKGMPETVSKQDVGLIEQLIEDHIKLYNKQVQSEFKIKTPTRDYSKQLIAIKNEKGERIVWANCSCYAEHKYPIWKKQITVTDDGGDCFFSIYINLSKMKCYKFYVNGVA